MHIQLKLGTGARKDEINVGNRCPNTDIIRSESILQMQWFNLLGPHQVFIILTDDDPRGQNVAFVK